jgi:hypothetical protein
LLNSLTARPRPGTQAQKVIFVALEDLHEPPASTVAPGLGAAPPLLLGEADDEFDGAGALVPQPARTATAVAPISQLAPRPAGKPRNALRLGPEL